MKPDILLSDDHILIIDGWVRFPFGRDSASGQTEGAERDERLLLINFLTPVTFLSSMKA